MLVYSCGKPWHTLSPPSFVYSSVFPLCVCRTSSLPKPQISHARNQSCPYSFPFKTFDLLNFNRIQKHQIRFQPVEIWEMIRMIATARIVMPQAMVRLSAGRVCFSMPEQTLCFLAGEGGREGEKEGGRETKGGREREGGRKEREGGRERERGREGGRERAREGGEREREREREGGGRERENSRGRNYFRHERERRERDRGREKKGARGIDSS